MVKCAKCGFLGVRGLDTGDLVGAGEELRERGVWPTNSERHRAFQDTPVCAVGACNFAQEMQGTDCESTADVLQKERQCSEFTEWIPALSPKEHLVMKLEATQKEWQRQCGNEDRQWRATQEELANKRHREWMQTHRITTFLAAILGACIAAVVAFLTRR